MFSCILRIERHSLTGSLLRPFFRGVRVLSGLLACSDAEMMHVTLQHMGCVTLNNATVGDVSKSAVRKVPWGEFVGGEGMKRGGFLHGGLVAGDEVWVGEGVNDMRRGIVKKFYQRAGVVCVCVDGEGLEWVVPACDCWWYDGGEGEGDEGEKNGMPGGGTEAEEEEEEEVCFCFTVCFLSVEKCRLCSACDFTHARACAHVYVTDHDPTFQSKNLKL